MVPIDDANSVRVIAPSTFVASVNQKVNRPTCALLDKTNVPSSPIVEIPTRRRCTLCSYTFSSSSGILDPPCGESNLVDRFPNIHLAC